MRDQPLLLKRSWVHAWYCSAMDGHPPGLNPHNMDAYGELVFLFPRDHTWFSLFQDPPLFL